MGRSKTPKKVLNDARPTVAHIQTFGCYIWVRIPDKARKTLEAKARSGILLKTLSYGEYWIMMESYQTVATSWYCIVKKDVFP